jgi:L-asparaginase
MPWTAGYAAQSKPGDGSELRPRIGLLVVPGTIDALRVPGSRRQPGMIASARVTAEEMVAAVSSLAAIPTTCIIPGPERLSHELTAVDWVEIFRKIQNVLDCDAVDGVVVTHGTNNLEEITYFLSLTVKSAKPVVVTGAMLPWNNVGTDGTSNLINAIRVAASEHSRSHGVLVAFGRDVFSPRTATKISTHALSAFAAPGAGPVGRLDGDNLVRYYQTPILPAADAPIIDLAAAGAMPRVDVIDSYIGADGVMIDACVDAGAAGLVTAAGGGGVTTTEEHKALLRAADKGVVVCQASRVTGGVVQLTEERVDNGFVAADNLSPWKARILLMLALTQTRDVAKIRHFFAVY